MIGVTFQFLSDLKPGKIIPLVLPESEETQFLQLVGNKIKKEVVENGESLNISSPPPTKKKFVFGVIHVSFTFTLFIFRSN